MKANHVRAKLKRGEASVGTWLNIPSAVSAAMMARTGFDWLTVEMEHTPFGFDQAAQCFSILAGHGVAPLARVPVGSLENIKRVLDTGAWGVIAPMINSRAEAEAVVHAARYAPLGNRSIGGQLHAINFDTDPATYYARANEEILVVVMLEHRRAVEAADEILSVPGIDVAFIGPNDLHHSYGLPPSFDSQAGEFVEALRHIRETARKHGVAPGIHVAHEADARRRIAEGFQFIAVASEAGMMAAKAREITGALGLGGDRVVMKY